MMMKIFHKRKKHVLKEKLQKLFTRLAIRKKVNQSISLDIIPFRKKAETKNLGFSFERQRLKFKNTSVSMNDFARWIYYGS